MVDYGRQCLVQDGNRSLIVLFSDEQSFLIEKHDIVLRSKEHFENEQNSEALLEQFVIASIPKRLREYTSAANIKVLCPIKEISSSKPVVRKLDHLRFSESVETFLQEDFTIFCNLGDWSSYRCFQNCMYCISLKNEGRSRGL